MFPFWCCCECFCNANYFAIYVDIGLVGSPGNYSGYAKAVGRFGYGQTTLYPVMYFNGTDLVDSNLYRLYENYPNSIPTGLFPTTVSDCFGDFKKSVYFTNLIDALSYLGFTLSYASAIDSFSGNIMFTRFT